MFPLFNAVHLYFYVIPKNVHLVVPIIIVVLFFFHVKSSLYNYFNIYSKA